MKRKELQHALEIVKPGLANKEMIEQSTSFAFMNNRVVTYNDEISISHPVEGLEIKGAIQANEMYTLLKKLKQENITISEEGNEIALNAGRVQAKMNLMQEIKLPLDEIGNIGKWKKLPLNFIKHLKFAMGACSKDMSRPVLTCVHVDKEGIIESSDSYRLARCKLPEAMPTNNFLLPATSALEVTRLNPEEIAESKSWIHFKTEQDTIISCRVYNDKFPSTENLLNVEGNEIPLPKSINEILDRASVFSKRDHFLDEFITVTLDKNRFIVQSKSEYGSFEEIAKINFNGNPIVFIITPYLLSDMLLDSPTCIHGNNRLKFIGKDNDWQYITALRETPKKK